MSSDLEHMRLALELAKRGFGTTSPNPMVGAVLINHGKIIGRGWHRRAGLPHAEIEALRNAKRLGNPTEDSTLYVTLEPCCTHGRTPPCTEAIIAAGIRKVVVGAGDPNPRHSGKGLTILRKAGIEVVKGVLRQECQDLNPVFNFWITHGRPYVTVKAAMTLDGKIATAAGESKWITGSTARSYAMRFRQSADAVLVGINTILADDPQLTIRNRKGAPHRTARTPRRIVLDHSARTPLTAHVVRDSLAANTTIVVAQNADGKRVRALASRVRVMPAPSSKGRIHLPWLLNKLGGEEVSHLLVEGGGEVNASFLSTGLAQRVAFFYAPKILGGAAARKAVAGDGAKGLADALDLHNVTWQRLGTDWILTGEIRNKR